MGCRIIDIVGNVYGRLTVIKLHGRDSFGKIVWKCRCSCGAICMVVGANLRYGITNSCGCLQRERAGESHTTHGLCHTEEYHIWAGIISRCYNPKHNRYVYYGARGIRVCSRWKKSVKKFCEDMGSRPSKKHSVERIDNSKGYSPDNWCWAVRKTQMRNKRSNHIIQWLGKSYCIAEWAEKYSIPYHIAQGRLSKGWSLDRILSQPFFLLRNRRSRGVKATPRAGK